MLDKIRNSLVLKINIAVIAIVVVAVALTLWISINAEREDLMEQLSDKGNNIATAMHQTAEDSIDTGNFFSIKEVIADLMKDEEFTYITLVNKEGKALVHSSTQREGRLFNDPVGIKAATAEKSLVQLYNRDDGKQYWDISSPIDNDGQHWGAIRIGIPTSQVDAIMSDSILKGAAMGLMIIILSGIIGTLLLRSAFRPMRELMKVTEVVAQGDFTNQINVKTSDEVGRLAMSFNSMVVSMRTLVAEIVGSSKEIAMASEQLSLNSEETVRAVQQVSSAVEDIARGNNSQTENLNTVTEAMDQINATTGMIASGAQEQAVNVRFTSETVHEMSSMVEKVTNEARAIKSGIMQTSDIAYDGGTAVRETIEGMSRIRSTVLESAEKIKELGEKSQQIGNIIQVIDEIAEQTNLLALNAAIESARAGEHGKGFAVVAEEVRKLAERSSLATKEIAALITDVQTETQNAVIAMGTGTEEVEKGVQLAGDADKALGKIIGAVNRSVRSIENIASASEKMYQNSIQVVDAIKNVASITEQSAAATEQMASGIGETSEAIQSVAAMAQEISASTEEISASVEEVNASTEEISASADKLAETAKGLSELITKFKV